MAAGLTIINLGPHWQTLQRMAHAKHRTLGRFDQPVEMLAGSCPFVRVAEQPVLSSDHQRLDRSFGGIIDYRPADRPFSTNLFRLLR